MNEEIKDINSSIEVAKDEFRKFKKSIETNKDVLHFTILGMIEILLLTAILIII